MNRNKNYFGKFFESDFSMLPFPYHILSRTKFDGISIIKITKKKSENTLKEIRCFFHMELKLKANILYFKLCILSNSRAKKTPKNDIWKSLFKNNKISK